MSQDRRSIYFRKDKDADIVSYINKLLKTHDFSEIVRSLMRDGIKYRESVQNKLSNPTQDRAPAIKPSPTVTQNEISPLPDIQLDKREISEDELKNRLDDF